MLAFYHDLYLKSRPSMFMKENKVMPIFCSSQTKLVPDPNENTEHTEKLSGEMHLLPCSFVQGAYYGL